MLDADEPSLMLEDEAEDVEEDLEGWRYFSEALKSWILVLISLSTSVRADIISNLRLLPKNEHRQYMSA